MLNRADNTGWLGGGGAALAAVNVHAAGQQEAKARVWPPTAPFRGSLMIGPIWTIFPIFNTYSYYSVFDYTYLGPVAGDPIQMRRCAASPRHYEKWQSEMYLVRI